MKKFFLLAVLIVASLGSVAFAQTAAEIRRDAVSFEWDKQNPYSAALGAVWYEVNLVNEVDDNEDILLYLNNATDDKTTAYVKVAVISLNSAGKETVEVLESMSRDIDPWYSYAKPVPHMLFGSFEVVYVQLQADRDLIFSAEPIEPGEKNLDCLNAPTLDLFGSNKIDANKDADKWQWYQVSVAKLFEDDSKTVKVLVKNVGETTATIVGGLSMDCPSTGLMEKTITLAAGATREFTIKRSYLTLVNQEDKSVYVAIKTNQKLEVTSQEVDAIPAQELTISDVKDFALDTQYELKGEQWYRVELESISEKRTVLELTVENKSNATATIVGDVIFSDNANLEVGEVAASRSVAVASGAAMIKEVQRNLIDAAISNNNKYAYVRANSNTAINFIVRKKAVSAGSYCTNPVDFDWDNGNIQAAGTTVWYAIDLKDVMKDPTHNILAKAENLSKSKQANVKAQVAFACPCETTTDFERVIAAGSELSTIIKYAIYGHLADSIVYVGLTTDQDVHIYAESVEGAKVSGNVCDEAVPFPIESGYNHFAGTDTWYQVEIRDIITNAQTKGIYPIITVTNLSSNGAVINGELVFDCVYNYEPQRRTIEIAPNGKYVKELTSDLLEGIHANYVYIHVTSNQNINIKVEFKQEKQGSSCTYAEDFVFGEVGVNYEAAEPYWYAVNVAKALKDKNDIIITVNNNNASFVNVKAEATVECPVRQGLAEYSFGVAANSSITKRLRYATLQAVGADVVYIRITADKNLNITAQLVEDNSPVTNICDYKFVDFEVEKGYEAEEDNLDIWFRVPLGQFKDGIVPQVTVINAYDGENHITAEFTFDCEAVKLESMMGKTIVLNEKGEEYTRTADKALLNLIEPEWEYAYIHVTAEHVFNINVELVDANDGEKCYDAIDFDWESGNVNPAGASLWYRVNLEEARAQTKAWIVGVENLDGFTGDVTADFYFVCPEEGETPFESYTYTLQAGNKREVRLGYSLLQALDADEILIHLYSAQEANLYAYSEEIKEPEVDPGCDEATKVQLNVWYDQAQEGQWYFVDVKDIKENTQGNVTLEIINSGAENSLTAALAWECEPREIMLDKQLTLAANQEYSRDIDSVLIANIANDTAWIYVTSKQDIKFRVSVNYLLGKDCKKPIEYDWENGSINPENAALCYHVSLDTLNADEIRDKYDLMVYVTNLSDEANNVTVNVLTGLGEGDAFTEEPIEKTLGPNMRYERHVSQSYVRKIFTDENKMELYVELESEHQVELFIEFVQQYREVICDTLVVDTVCPGYVFTYVDPEGERHDVLIDEKTEQEFIIEKMTYIVSDNGAEFDSIVGYKFYHYIAPQVPMLKDLEFVQYKGGNLDLNPLTEKIVEKIEELNKDQDQKLLMSYYVEDIVWEYFDPQTGFVELPNGVYNEKCPFDALSGLTVKYTIPTGCDDYNISLQNSKYGEILSLSDEYIEIRGTVQKDPVCPGEVVTHLGINGNITYTIDRDIVINDTVFVSDSVEVGNYKQDALIITPNEYHVLHQPKLTTAGISSNFRGTDAQVGYPVNTTDATATINESLKEQAAADKYLAEVTAGPTWYIKNADGNFVALTADPLAADYLDENGNITLYYTISTECDNELVSDEITVKANTKTVENDIQNIDGGIVCVGFVTDRTELNPDGVKIEKDTTWTEIWDKEEVTKTIHHEYTYTYGVYTDYKAVNVAAINAQIGGLLSVKETEAEIMAALKAQSDANDTVKALAATELTWTADDAAIVIDEITNAGLRLTHSFDKYVSTGIVLHYSIATDCKGVVEGDVIVNVAAAQETTGTATDVYLCPDEEHTTLGAKNVIKGSDITDGVLQINEIAELEDQSNPNLWKDVRYVYDVYVYAQYQAVGITSMNAQVGTILSVADVEAAILAELDAQNANKAVVTYEGTMTWSVAAGNIAIGDRLTNANTANAIKLHYSIATTCGGTFAGDIDVVVEAATEVDGGNVTTTVCAKEGYMTKLGFHITDAMHYEEVDYLADQTDAALWKDIRYTYDITIFDEIVVDAAQLTEPIAICGEEIDYAQAKADLEAIVLAGTYVQQSTILWEVKLGDGEYEVLDRQVPNATHGTVTLRYTVNGECDVVTGEIEVPVQEPTSLNNTDKLGVQEAVIKYEGWLLMLNYNTTKANALKLGFELTEDLVEWYLVVGEPDITSGEENDELVGTGYYYTENDILPEGNQYYAKINVPAQTEEECGGYMFTNLLEIPVASQALSLAPNMVQPGDNMYLTGLNADNTYVISVYDLTGICVERYEVKDTESFTLQAQSVNGYYMVEVNAQSDNVRNETFKYVVK